MIQKTILQSNKAPMYEPNGTPSITAMTSPPFTRATAPVFLFGGEITIAKLIMTPKNGACIEADNKRDNSSTSKFGAVAATILETINIEIKIIKSNFGDNLNVNNRITGPNTATLSA